MKRYILVCFLFSGVITNATETLVIPLGGSKKISTYPNEKIVLSKGRIARAIDHQNYIQVYGKHEGETALRVGGRSFHLLVVSPQKYDSLQQLQNLLKDLMGLQVKYVNKKIVIFGKLYRLSDWLQIVDFFRHHSLDFQFEAQPVFEIQDSIREHFQSIATSHGLPYPNIQWKPKMNFYVSQKTKNLDIYSGYGITARLHKALVERKPMIKVRVHILETQRSALKQIGVQWPTSYNLSIGKKVSSNFQLDTVLHFLESSGSGQVIADPILTCESGSKASFHSGGEVPIISQNKRRRYVEWKNHGIELNISPTADSLNHIRTSVEAKISVPMGTANPEGVPAFKVHRVQSTFNLKSKQSLALSGLIESLSLESVSEISGLAKLPLLGQLFSSRRFHENKSELTILVTPEVLIGTP